MQVRNTHSFGPRDAKDFNLLSPLKHLPFAANVGSWLQPETLCLLRIDLLVSVMLLNAITMVLHKAIEVNGELVAESFVDDLTLLSSKPSILQSAVDTIADFMSLTDQQVNGCSHEILLHFGLESSELNICYYHEDLHQELFYSGLRQELRSNTPCPPTHCSIVEQQGLRIGHTLKEHPISTPVHSAGEL